MSALSLFDFTIAKNSLQLNKITQAFKLLVFLTKHSNVSTKRKKGPPTFINCHKVVA